MMQRDSPVDELVVLDIVLFTIMPGLCLECAWYCSVTLTVLLLIVVDAGI